MAEISNETLKLEASKLIKEGKSKQETYESLLELTRNRKLIADIVRYTPTKEKLSKYGIWNTLFIVFISIVVVLFSLVQFSMHIIWPVLLLLVVAMKRFKLYYFNTIFGIVTMLGISGLVLYELVNDGLEHSVFTTLCVLPIPVLFILGGVLLPKKITPKYEEKKERYTDNNGRQRIRIVHYFEE